MKKSILLASITVFLVIFTSTAYADDVILIRLSYKVVLNPASGTRPPGVTDADIDNAIAAMNALEETYFRGFRFVRVDPVTNIGGRGDTTGTGPSKWYNTDFFTVDGAKDQMQAEALANRARYAWNSNAVNLYITNWNGICGGICSFASDEIIIIGGCTDGSGVLQLHEIGHYFGLCHTQGCPCASCTPGMIGTCNTFPGDDGIADTLPDLQCWTQDNIANFTFNTNYASLTPAQQQQVDDVFFNIMSYHGGRTRMTELQLDIWANAAASIRRSVTDGRTYFVQVGSGLFGNGFSNNPFPTVRRGVEAAANSGDIVLLRPGAYNEWPLTIGTGNKAVTLRAPRQGPAVIGGTTGASSVVSRPIEEIEVELRKLPGLNVDRGEARLDFAGSDGKK